MDDDSAFPLIDKNDHDILMHRDAHFSGSFTIMIDYYLKQGKGSQPDFEMKRLKELELMQKKASQDLSELFLTEEEREEVQKSKDKYLYLRELYNSATAKLPQMIADLILSEDIEAKEEIRQLVSQGSAAVPLLIDLLAQDEFYRPLYPGYGLAPAHAAICLGKIGDPKAIPVLFQALGRADFFTEEALLEALVQLGEPAKKYLLNSLTNEPFSKENENAAIALLSFGEDPDVSKTCLGLLQKPQILTKPIFATYLILGCESLKDPSDQEVFTKFSQIATLPRELQQEMQAVIKSWKKR